jgi:predicted nucleotide-binding protein (sugar kinase/HSP70/actin superfamily)
MSKLEKLEFMIKKKFMSKYEKRIKSILSRSGLVHAEPLDMKSIINSASPYISPYLGGEAILTVGGALTEVASHVCGAIAIGPFGCMPNRLSESILNVTMNREGKLATDPRNKQLRHILTNIEDLPFMAIESDGSPFPQLINAKLETFCIRSERLHNRMLEANHKNRKCSRSRLET